MLSVRSHTRSATTHFPFWVKVWRRVSLNIMMQCNGRRQEMLMSITTVRRHTRAIISTVIINIIKSRFNLSCLLLTFWQRQQMLPNVNNKEERLDLDLIILIMSDNQPISLFKLFILSYSDGMTLRHIWCWARLVSFLLNKHPCRGGSPFPHGEWAES